MADTLGARISENRKRRQKSQEQLAEHLGVTAQAVSKWENDISCPDITLLPQLADFFSISVDELLRGRNRNEVQLLPENERKDFNKMTLRIYVFSNDGDEVKINLPMPLLKAAIEIGVQLPQMTGNIGGDALKNIDFTSIIQMVENGLIGKLVEIKSADNDIVEISVE